MVRFLVPLALVLLVAGPALALHESPATSVLPGTPPGVPEPPDPRDAVQEAQRRAKDAYSGMTGERLDREDVDVAMRMEFRDLDVEPFAVAFGGGRIAAEARLTTRIDFHVVSVQRIQEAVEEATGFPANLTELGIDARSQYLTADAFRATLVGEALAAFQEEQERRAVRLLADSFPDVSVRASRFEWANTTTALRERGASLPGQAPEHDPRNPPVTLVSVLDLEYQKRRSLAGLVEDLLASPPSLGRAGAGGEDAAEASPFALLGVTQTLRLRVPPGWDLTLALELPEGLTFESASPDVALAENMREARASAHAGDSDVEVASAVALTVGSRHAVALGLLAAVLAVGAVLRVPGILVANRLVRRRRR